jgi:hypothetical protein
MQPTELLSASQEYLVFCFVMLMCLCFKLRWKDVTGWVEYSDIACTYDIIQDSYGSNVT